ncbi:hypothetical protein JW887_00075 [Candidatus Dojkabacteria bacterium]|nr:hypothetical protein [Candidatus Dojkabacteria bacterium]
MPRFDGTGPNRPEIIGRRQVNRRLQKQTPGRRQGGTKFCTCPKCGYKEAHTRGIPCTEKKCPKCGTMMNGIFCA